MARRRRCPPAIEAQMWMGSPVMRRLTAGCLGRLVLTVGCEMAPHGFMRKWAYSRNERDETSLWGELQESVRVIGEGMTAKMSACYRRYFEKEHGIDRKGPPG